jgi:hypothetical protein
MAGSRRIIVGIGWPFGGVLGKRAIDGFTAWASCKRDEMATSKDEPTAPRGGTPGSPQAQVTRLGEGPMLRSAEHEGS